MMSFSRIFVSTKFIAITIVEKEGLKKKEKA